MSIDAFVVGSCVAMGTGVALLHKQKGANALNLALEGAVSQSLALRAQATCSHPLSVLLLLGGKERQSEQAGAIREDGKNTTCVCSLTFSQRRKTSFMPSGAGISSLIRNFCAATLTSGATSHPENRISIKF